MMLIIGENGSIDYERVNGSKTTSLGGAKIESFEGDDFTAGWFLLSTKFAVSKKPEKVGDEWKMTVDGVELTRHTGRIERAGAATCEKKGKDLDCTLAHDGGIGPIKACVTLQATCGTTEVEAPKRCETIAVGEHVDYSIALAELSPECEKHLTKLSLDKFSVAKP
ncbi:MAG: hypothetical protein U0235_33110 [Polyangiaceae bacterium]